MIINITHKTTIKDIQRKMNVAYPFLKIEFADKSHQQGEKSPKCHWYDHSFKLLDIAKKSQAGWIVMQPWQKTGSVEEIFESRFGLHAQIFRKEKDQWIETAGTDVFTIEEQNEIGRKMVDKIHRPFRRERELLL
jgi:hypothetical protein